jgi:hypothetical protein
MSAILAFDDIPRTARGHMSVLAHEAVHRLVLTLRARAIAADERLENVYEAFPVLAPYFSGVQARVPDGLRWDASLDWFRSQAEHWLVGAPAELPLRPLAASPSLGHTALVAIALTGLIEEEPRFADVIAALHGTGGQRRITIALLAELLADADGDRDSVISRRLLDAGLLQAMDESVPRGEWQLRVPSILWSAAIGECGDVSLRGMLHQTLTTLPVLEELVLAARLRDRLLNVPPMLARGDATALIIRGSSGSDRLEVAAAIAQALGLSVLELSGAASISATDERLRLLGPLATLLHALPVFVGELGPGETWQLPQTVGATNPCVFVLGHEGGVTGPLAERAITVVLETETMELRARQWRRALGARAVDNLDAIVERYALPGGYVRQCANLAATTASLAGRNTLTEDDVREAARSLNRQHLDSLATRIDEGGGWSQLVVSDATLGELRGLEHRCRHRERLSNALSSDIPGGINRGVRALFEGPSGTGKTLAARVLAAELGRDLYRVDLAAVVNKYIGETEKNLSRILSRAEELDVVLLLDEGDALLSQRTDVKSSTDRYANLETNYLLTRMDSYLGILIVTTNSGAAIDVAFRRRIDTLVKFSVPDAEQRFQLWIAHLPRDHVVHATELERIALRYQLTGGQIRNVAVGATLRALGRADARVRELDIEEGLRGEYRKAGAAFPASMIASYAASRAPSLDAFLDAIA